MILSFSGMFFLVVLASFYRHSFTTRLLLTCIRSKLYYKEETTDDIFSEIAKQAIELFNAGLQVSYTSIM